VIAKKRNCENAGRSDRAPANDSDLHDFHLIFSILQRAEIRFQCVSPDLTDFLKLLRKHYALTSSLPPHLE
jgi:hypothetical protein